MLSLIVVLSVYYITAPEQSPVNMAYVDGDEEQASDEEGNEEELGTENDENSDAALETDSETQVTNVDGDEMFAALRLKINEAREKQLEEYQEVVASAELSAELKSEAFSKMEELNDQSKQIYVLETLLMNQYDYEDVIVNPIGEGNYNVIVKTDALSNQEANEIMRKTVDHLGNGIVTVEYSKR